MPLNTEILFLVWTITGLFGIYIGVVNLRYPDAAWERAERANQKRGVTIKRTARWERSRVFTGVLTAVIGLTLLGMVAWGFLQTTQKVPITYTDVATGKTITRWLTPGELKEFNKDPSAFILTPDASTTNR